MNGITQADLRRSVALAVRGGMSQTQASRKYGVSVRAANKWVAIDRAGGLRALRLRRRGRREGQGCLNREQALRIRQLIVDKLPDRQKLPYHLWTRAALATLIKREYGIAISLTTASRYLKGWGMRVQGVTGRVNEGGNSAITRSSEYHAIVRQAKRDNAVIYWADAVGLRRDHVAALGNFSAGQASNGGITSQRVACNMISGTTNRGHRAFIVLHGKFDGAQFVQFMQRLLKQAGTNIYLIVERQSVHRSSSVKHFVTAKAAQIRLINLIGDGSERNSDESRNEDVKADSVGRSRPTNLSAVMSTVRSHLPHRQRERRGINRYFPDKCVRNLA
jgi:transposase